MFPTDDINLKEIYYITWMFEIGFERVLEKRTKHFQRKRRYIQVSLMTFESMLHLQIKYLFFLFTYNQVGHTKNYFAAHLNTPNKCQH